jgi:site-specific recombinase XerD
MTMLDSIAPNEAVQMYLDDRKPEVTQNTLYEHKCRLNRFLEWSREEGLDDMNEMTRRTVHAYKQYRADEVAPTTLEHEMRTFRIFLRFRESINGVADGVASSLSLPKASRNERSRDVSLSQQRAERILDYLDTYEYGSLRHVLFHLLWNLGCRIGGVRALDLGDFHEDGPDGPFIEFVHRPDARTPLKNKWRSERKPPIRDDLRDLLVDYIEQARHDVTDEYGREPLLTTEQGRPVRSTIQRNVYAVTRPCYYTNECPHDRDLDECEAVGEYNSASKCPSSHSPHALRRGSATRDLNDGMPEEMASDRLDMSPGVLREHYNAQTEEDKRGLQREFLDNM